MGRPAEETVHEWRAILEADDTASLHNEHQRALCDSWLAQREALREIAECLSIAKLLGND